MVSSRGRHQAAVAVSTVLVASSSAGILLAETPVVSAASLLYVPLHASGPLPPVRSMRSDDPTNITYDDEIDHDPLFRGIGTHYVNVHVGCGPNPQVQTLIVDTGSSHAAFPCSGCKANCGEGSQLHPPYDESKSTCFRSSSCDDSAFRGDCTSCISSSTTNIITGSTANNEQCRVSQRYVEGSSWRGFVASDNITLGTSNEDEVSHELSFVCQDALTGLFRTQLADGIMGLAKGPTAVWQQMYRRGTMPRRQFSLCYQHTQEAKMDAGLLTLGGNDDRFHEGPMVYAHDYGGVVDEFWQVEIRQIYLLAGGEEDVIGAFLRGNATAEDSNNANSKSPVIERVSLGGVSISNLRPIVDSGTTYTYLSNDLLVPIRQAWAKMTSVTFGAYNLLSEEEICKLPTILFQLHGAESSDDPHNNVGSTVEVLDPEHPNDVLVAFPPSRYMKPGSGFFRIYFEPGEGVLGANFIAGHHVHFDFEGDRIGFSESDCMLLGSDDRDGTSPGISTAPTAAPAVSESESPTSAGTNGASRMTSPLMHCILALLLHYFNGRV